MSAFLFQKMPSIGRTQTNSPEEIQGQATSSCGGIFYTGAPLSFALLRDRSDRRSLPHNTVKLFFFLISER
jgi:hypothetical protein